MVTLYILFFLLVVLGIAALRWEPIVLTVPSARDGNDVRIGLAFTNSALIHTAKDATRLVLYTQAV